MNSKFRIKLQLSTKIYTQTVIYTHKKKDKHILEKQKIKSINFLVVAFIFHFFYKNIYNGTTNDLNVTLS